MNSSPQPPDQTRAMHHFVTCAYLEGMLTSGESRLWVYERNSDHVFRNLPKNLASKKSYYAIRGKGGVENDKFEKMLAVEIEGPGITVLRRVSCDMNQLNWREREQIAIMVAMQELRVPFMRDQLSQMMKGIHTSFMHSIISKPGLLERNLEDLRAKGRVLGTITADEMRNAVINGDLTLEMFPEASLRALSHSLSPMVNVYVKMKWTVLISNEISFVTSDCPVCRDYPQTNKFPAGIVNPDLTVYFPISQNQVLKLTHDHKKYELFRHLMRIGDQRKANQLQERTPAVPYRFISKDESEVINSLIIRRAQRWVYSPIEMPSVLKHFRGECVNLRMNLESEPDDGFVKWSNRIS